MQDYQTKELIKTYGLKDKGVSAMLLTNCAAVMIA
jgi:hypothetical protein